VPRQGKERRHDRREEKKRSFRCCEEENENRVKRVKKKKNKKKNKDQKERKERGRVLYQRHKKGEVYSSVIDSREEGEHLDLIPKQTY